MWKKLYELYLYINRLGAWTSWVAHGLIGFAGAFLAGEVGGGLAIGFYTGKEFKESDSLRNISRDNVMDWVCPVIGAALGWTLRAMVW